MQEKKNTLFENAVLEVEALKHSAKSYIAEFNQVCNDAYRSFSLPVVVHQNWVLPVVGVYKMNVDDGVGVEDGVCGIGGII